MDTISSQASGRRLECSHCRPLGKGRSAGGFETSRAQLFAQRKNARRVYAGCLDVRLHHTVWPWLPVTCAGVQSIPALPVAASPRARRIPWMSRSARKSLRSGPLDPVKFSFLWRGLTYRTNGPPFESTTILMMLSHPGLAKDSGSQQRGQVQQHHVPLHSHLHVCRYVIHDRRWACTDFLWAAP